MDDDLFSSAGAGGGPGEQRPLADRMRPRVLDDVIGQDHIVGPGRLLRRAIQADRLSSVIFYGPPGTGKTSLARVIANTTRSTFESLNAVLTGIKDIREVIDRADERRRLYDKRTILFVDEVHRWNKAQQDALLPWVENGAVILIGATTENPFFEVNRALVSRSRIFQLKSLTYDDLLKTALRAIQDKERGYGKWNIVFESGALEHLVEVSGGDARSLLNALELAVETSPRASQFNPAVSRWPPEAGAEIYVSFEAAEESIQKRAVLYDRDGDYHFDTISAFIKSIRGSDPDAAMYWLAKMVRAGEDPSFIFRRMIILAMEDVGLADPNAIREVIACAEAFDRIGFPEGNFALSLACLYLATAPKSNTTLAFFDAFSAVDKEDAEVPNHLRDTSRDAESFGHGEGYIYPHAYRDHWAAQQYLPTSLRGKVFYSPSISGYEGKIREEVLRKREIQAAVILGDAAAETAADGEILTWSASSKGREGWFKRLESGRSALLLSDRDIIIKEANIRRHDRVLVAAANDGLLLWESLRHTPEGLSAAIVDSEAAKEALLRFAAAIDEEEKPLVMIYPSGGLPLPREALSAFGSAEFDHIVAREPWRRMSAALIPGEETFSAFAEKARDLLTKTGDIILLQSPPSLGERISRLLDEFLLSGFSGIPDGLSALLKKAEDVFFTQKGKEAGRWVWDGELLQNCFIKTGFTVTIAEIEQKEERLLSEKDLLTWFDKEKSSWGKFMFANLGEKDFLEIKNVLGSRIKEGPLTWRWKSLLLKGKL